jgi:GntR family transcriptional regulator
MSLTLPLHLQLKEVIVAGIGEGDFPPGSQLPTQRAMGERYGMSHMTVRRAIDELIKEQVIYAVPGKGIFVSDQKRDAEAGPLVGFTEDMAQRGMQASSRVLESDIIRPSTMLAQTLRVAVDTPLVYLRRLRLADGEPMALQTNYLPHALCPGVLKYNLENESLFAILRNTYGLHLVRNTNAVEAALANEEQAALLGLNRPAPLLINEQITYLDTNQVIEFVRSVYRADRYRLRTGSLH